MKRLGAKFCNGSLCWELNVWFNYYAFAHDVAINQAYVSFILYTGRKMLKPAKFGKTSRKMIIGDTMMYSRSAKNGFSYVFSTQCNVLK